MARRVGMDDIAQMAKPRIKDLPDLRHLAVPGADIALRATPRAARDGISFRDGQLRVSVTAVPENGRANLAVRLLLAAAMGVAQSDLILLRGQTSRDKLFRYGGASRS